MKYKSMLTMLDESRRSLASIKFALKSKGIKMSKDTEDNFLKAANHMITMTTNITKKSGQKSSLGKLNERSFRGPGLSFRLKEAPMSICVNMKGLVNVMITDFKHIGTKDSSTKNKTVSNDRNEHIKLDNNFMAARNKAVKLLEEISTNLTDVSDAMYEEAAKAQEEEKED